MAIFLNAYGLTLVVSDIAKYLAIDQDGEIFSYSDTPVCLPFSWGGDWLDYVETIDLTTTKIEWENSLIEITDEITIVKCEGFEDL